ncbi:ABC transporter permease [Candidatus Xianfuyuplasma coldseepsis]|uniref:Iron ABC transporter permease n=1 Tax=Candidatus Xianfuyuplasma coldseepsis TaxID=2782163 RepID=A0A7L7KSI8_9MOLU|nr:iron ABC transporter permease [Xianfuyuplasma coldseepsis]QMS85379.1 iron ABC transporter permease [Xianfuyuplasma coldseepsis]
MQRIIRRLHDRTIFVVVGFLVPLVIVLPLLRIGLNALEPRSLYYQTLLQNNILVTSVVATIELIIKVGLLSAFVGFIAAYFLTFYEIKFRKVINVLLVLPLGIPVYVAAYTYTNIFHYIPFLEAILRADFMMNGAVFIYSFFLYPYVYLASKSYLSKHITDYIEASETLGGQHLKLFIKIILPLSRPVIIGSVLFAIFETLSDFAVVEYYGVLTLSRYINLAWFSNGDFISASKLSVYILMIMFVLIFIERVSRRQKRYSSADVIHRPIRRYNPSKSMMYIIYVFIGTIIVLATILPITQMLVSVIMNTAYIERLDIIEITFNTLLITVVSTIIIIIVALLLATITIYIKGAKKHLLSSVSTIGYMVPSMVLALGIYILLIRVDQWLYHMFQGVGLNRMLFTSTIAIILFGFFVKFFSVAYTNLLSAYSKMNHHLLEASETLGESKLSTMVRVTIPMLSKSIIAVAIILFIDMAKELTIVYSLRPFNFKTLSTEVYRYAGNEMINIAAFPSLVIIAMCTLLILYLEGGSKRVKTP